MGISPWWDNGTEGATVKTDIESSTSSENSLLASKGKSAITPDLGLVRVNASVDMQNAYGWSTSRPSRNW